MNASQVQAQVLASMVESVAALAELNRIVVSLEKELTKATTPTL